MTKHVYMHWLTSRSGHTLELHHDGCHSWAAQREVWKWLGQGLLSFREAMQLCGQVRRACQIEHTSQLIAKHLEVL